MGFLDRLADSLFGRRAPSAPEAPEEGADLKMATGRPDPEEKKRVEIYVQENRRVPRRDIVREALTAYRSVDTGNYKKPMHDLAETLKLYDIESYFRLSVTRHVELIMKAGFRFKGRNPETVAWVKRRIQEISLMSDQPFESLMRDIVFGLVTTSNSFFVTTRDRERASGARIKMWGRELDPIAALTVPDSSTVAVVQNSNGRASSWKQVLPGSGGPQKTWPFYDVVHFSYSRKPGYIFGVPYVVPVLEDIRALRKLEALAEHVAHKYAFPLMHWKVGTDEWPAEYYVDPASGEKIPETVVADQYASQLQQEGYVVTSNRHEVSLLGVQGEKMDLKPLLEHYRDRALAGLRLSKLDVGEGDSSNRSTAQVLSQILVDSCMEFQKVVAETINFRLLLPLVLEGGFDYNPDNEVVLFWPPIDAEAQRAHENHWLNLYVSGGVTREEFRNEGMGRDDLTPEEEQNTFMYTVALPTMEAGAKFKEKYAPAKESSTKNSAQPTNQYGTLGTKPRIAKRDEVDLLVGQIIERYVSGSKAREFPGNIDAFVTKKVNNFASPLFREAFKTGWDSHSKNEPLPVTIEGSDVDRLERFVAADLLDITRAARVATGTFSKTHLDLECSPTELHSRLQVLRTLVNLKMDRAVTMFSNLGAAKALAHAGAAKVNGLDEKDAVVETYDITSEDARFDTAVRTALSGHLKMVAA